LRIKDADVVIPLEGSSADAVLLPTGAFLEGGKMYKYDKRGVRYPVKADGSRDVPTSRPLGWKTEEWFSLPKEARDNVIELEKARKRKERATRGDGSPGSSTDLPQLFATPAIAAVSIEEIETVSHAKGPVTPLGESSGSLSAAKVPVTSQEGSSRYPNAGENIMRHHKLNKTGPPKDTKHVVCAALCMAGVMGVVRLLTSCLMMTAQIVRGQMTKMT